MNRSLGYVLLTACRNEEAYIEATINSVVGQTILPQGWVIINDGSTDDTEKILQSCSRKYPFIKVVNKVVTKERNFGSKADAVNLGYTKLDHINFDFVGNLDADVTFDSTYYESVLEKFKSNEKLGVAGGARLDYIKGKFFPVKCARNSVGGPFQFFRRRCWEEIGGYTPLEYGGIDAVAEISARMLGWQVKSYPDLIAHHHRSTGGAQRNAVVYAFRNGIKAYKIGYHPLFQILKSIERMRKRPYLIGGVFTLLGYFASVFIHSERPVPDDFVTYLRTEQLQRIKTALLTINPNAV